MPRFRFGKSEQLAESPGNIEIVQDSGAVLILQGRILPNRQTIWAIIRKVQSEVEEWSTEGYDATIAARDQVCDTLQWAIHLLYCLGYDYQDIKGDLGSLARLAEFEAPQIGRAIGQTA